MRQHPVGSSPSVTLADRWSGSHSLAALLGLTLFILLLEMSFLTDANLFFLEGYGIERVTVTLYVVAILLWVWRAPDQSSWQVPVALALMAMREMDFDKRFSEIGVLKSQYYLRDAPISDKLAGIALLIVLCVTVWRLLRHNLRPWLRDLRAGWLDAWLVAVGVLCVVVSKTIDGIDRKLAPFGITFAPETVKASAKVEEILEMALIFCFCQAIALYAQRSRR